MNKSGRKLTSKQVARLLGVSEASVKRWADSGILPTEKTVGGHRRFRSQDIALFRRERFSTSGQQQTINSPTGSEQNGHSAVSSDADDEGLASEMFDALVLGRAEDAAAPIVTAYLRGGRSVASLCDSVLAKAMHRIGDLWHQGELTVAKEHLATQAALTALRTLHGVSSTNGAHGLLAICCSTEEDFHELPIRVAELIFKCHGWEVVNLGPHTPFYALTETVTDYHPRIICIASTVLPNLDRATREYKEFRQAAELKDVSIVLGGAGFADEKVRRRFPAALHAQTFQQLDEFIVASAASAIEPPTR